MSASDAIKRLQEYPPDEEVMIVAGLADPFACQVQGLIVSACSGAITPSQAALDIAELYREYKNPEPLERLHGAVIG